MIRFSASVFASFAIVAASAACGSSTPPPARAIIESDFGPPGPGAPGTCNVSDITWIDIGGFGNPPIVPVTTVDNGTANTDATGAGQVGVTCSVQGSDAAGYNVIATATLASGATSGTISITGKFTISGQQTGISAVFQRADYGTFTESDCTVDYDYTVNPNMGIAAGRVWGELTCPAITRADENLTCAATAQFRFENCDQ